MVGCSVRGETADGRRQYDCAELGAADTVVDLVADRTDEIHQSRRDGVTSSSPGLRGSRVEVGHRDIGHEANARLDTGHPRGQRENISSRENRE